MKSIYVTRSFLPPLDDYNSYLKKIWKSGVLTNDGPIIKEFERKLSEFAGCKNAVAVANGTLALQLAIRALDLKGEIITTPFSFVATASSIIWESCKPVFADIDPDTLNIDPAGIRRKINARTVGILPVHVYGNPCAVDEIGSIARANGLKVIYDACHALGVKYKGKPLFSYGDISVSSLHATKIINTGEGGVLFTHSNRLTTKLKRLRNCGYSNYKIYGVGINAKMSEFNAALGLASFRHLKSIIAKRRSAYNHYKKLFSKNSRIRYPSFNGQQNYAYFPIILSSEKLKKTVISDLNKKNIHPREYFNPTLELVFGKKITCPVAWDISKRVLCLPLSSYTKKSETEMISRIVNKTCFG